MNNFENSKISFGAEMTLEPPEPFLPTDNSAPHPSNTTPTSSNATQTSGKKEEEKKEEKEEEQQQQKKTKYQKKKQKEKENQEKLSQAETELATLKASHEVTITERDTLKKDLEKSNKLHDASSVHVAESLIKKYNDIKELKVKIRALEATNEGLTVAAAEENDIVTELIKELVVESIKREEDLKALDVPPATAVEEGAVTEELTTAATEAQGENGTLKKELEDLKKELSEAKKGEGFLNTFKRLMMERIKAREAELAATVDKAQWLREKMDILMQELDESEEREQSLRIHNYSLLEKVREMDAKIGAMTAATTEAEGKIKEPTATEAEANAEVEKLTAAVDEADAEIEEQNVAEAEVGGSEDNDDNAGEEWSVGAAITKVVRLRNRDLADRY